MDPDETAFRDLAFRWVQRHVGAVVAMRPEDIRPNDTYDGLIGSLDEVDLLLSIEDVFGIHPPDSHAEYNIAAQPLTMHGLAEFLSDQVLGIFRNTCGKCGYDNTELDTGICPECGGCVDRSPTACLLCGSPTPEVRHTYCQICRDSMIAGAQRRIRSGS